MTDILGSPVQALKGVGNRRAGLLARLGIVTVGDLIRHYPRSYEDWSTVIPLSDAPFNQPCCVKATALRTPSGHMIRKGLTLYKFVITDGTATATVTLFNNKYLAEKIRANNEYLFLGAISGTSVKREMASPMIELPDSGQRLRPIYRQTEGLSSRILEACVSQAFDALCDELDNDPVPESIREEYMLCTRKFAFENIHFPTSSDALSVARRRLVFEELFVLQLGFLQLKGRTKAENRCAMRNDCIDEFVKLLPFTLTSAQLRTIGECVNDMSGCHPMSRLVQGDVGSGKTAVAAALIYTAAKSGFQSTLMAPTEILAEQHYNSLSVLLNKAGIATGLLKGSMTAAQKRDCLEELSAGRIDLAIGTHALLSDKTEFKKLGLVITDEQHRFGVAQRSALAAKGNEPHILVMSATPIPRTLALIMYGDLNVSVLDELPPGRCPVKTYHINSAKRQRAYGFVKKHIDSGRQAYIVCPLVEDPEQESDLASATEYADALAVGAFKGYSLGLLHGKMKSADKENVMSRFSAGDISVLVSTTVIEVGVDVPNAVIMIIENAERFGLAQLHQLRGRVGRGQHESSCILVSDAQNEEAVRRLRVMCSTNDGFKIADEDLKLRGPGDFFGNRQHGLPNLKIADLMTDSSLLLSAQQAAASVLTNDSALQKPEHAGLYALIRELFGRVGTHGLN